MPAPIWWTQINYGPVANEQIQLADVDGDGKDDVFWANPYDGRWYISYGATSLWSVGGAVNVPYDQLRLGDLNGDGKDDVFWIRPWDGDWLVSYGAVSGWAIINNSNIPVAQIRLAATGSAP
ncbi:FG-GAP-like repeat-containing protein [Cellulomonas chengniuliangii]|uniref:FG-GAP-like repeat-containing protein n=1 Tax=Cellulomonas chengniuliangii TaxID=2968084 RepID=UPI001D0E93CF|nr:FG-GAP-like repeat-containing protein [Cellulomonas chengniuliangii]